MADKEGPKVEDTGTGDKKETDGNPGESGSPKLLDLAFGVDCTASMASYIFSAQQEMRSIVEEIVAKEAADVRLALVEYRDHPPQEQSFVTRVHDFTESVREMRDWLDSCAARGGGDEPEAVADALHDLLKLSWRDDATKICVLISDAPPHGLDPAGDGFPNGCPDGHDPMVLAGQLARKGVTLYQVGCEPAILRYKQFFTGLAHVTGGQYVPLNHAGLLAQVIIGGAREELSLQQTMEQVHRQVRQEVEHAEPGSLSHGELSHRVHSRLQAYGLKSKRMLLNQQALPRAGRGARDISHCTSMAEARARWRQSSARLRDLSPGRDARAFSPALTRSMRSESVRNSRKKKQSGVLSSLKKWALGSRGKSQKKEGAGVHRSHDSDSDFDEFAAPPPSAFVTPYRGRSGSFCLDHEPDEEADIRAFQELGYVPPSSYVTAHRGRSGSLSLDYEVDEEADIGEEQVFRMVQKSLMQNELVSRLRRDSAGSH